MKLEVWIKNLVLLNLIAGLLGTGTMFLSNISYIQGFRVQILYFVILCFSNSALLHGLKLRKISCGILWLVFGLMETIMILIYTISHCSIAIKTNDVKTLMIPLLFLFAGVINIVSWLIVYQFVQKLSKEGSQWFPTNTDGLVNQNHAQIRYNADGRIDILQDISRLSPGVYSIAPVHSKTTTSCSTFMPTDGIRNDLMLYPSPESGIFDSSVKNTIFLDNNTNYLYKKLKSV